MATFGTTFQIRLNAKFENTRAHMIDGLLMGHLLSPSQLKGIQGTDCVHTRTDATMETSTTELKPKGTLHAETTKEGEDSSGSDADSVRAEERQYEEDARWYECEDGDDDDDEDKTEEESVEPSPSIGPDEDDKYNARLRKVSKAINQVAPPGGFFANGEHIVFPQPVISVQGIGDLVPPLTDSVMKELIAKCQLAPYGHGEKTLVNTQVRNTWELSVDQFQLPNSAWSLWSHFVKDEILPSIRVPLGIDDSVKVEAKLYKMLLYEVGGKFEKHQDSEKEDGMFGTLVVVLPGRFEGGELVVHDPSTAQDASSSDAANTTARVWNPASMGPFAVKYAAFYGDCPHEVKPVTKGYRLCLTYNLVNIATSETVPRFGGNHQLYATLKDALCEFFSAQRANEAKRQRVDEEGGAYDFDIASPDTHRECKFVYVLNHKYTQAGLSFQYLKNKDAFVADCLARFCDESNGAFGLYLSKIKYEFEWYGPQSTKYKKRYRKDPSNSEALYLLSPWVVHAATMDGRSIHVADEAPHCRIEGDLEAEVAPTGVFHLDELDFDGENNQLLPGNAGAQYDRWYQSAALLVVPLAVALKAQWSTTPKAAMKRWATIAETSPRQALAVVAMFRNAFLKGAFPFRTGDKALEAASKLGNLRAVHSVLTSYSVLEFLPNLRRIVAPFETDAVAAMAMSIYSAWTKAKHVDAVVLKMNCVVFVASLLNGVKDPAVIEPILHAVPIETYNVKEAKAYHAEFSVCIDNYTRVLRAAVRVSVEEAKRLIQTTPVEFFVCVVAPAVQRIGTKYNAEGKANTRDVVSFTFEQLTKCLAAIRATAFKNKRVNCGCSGHCSHCRTINEFLASDDESTSLSKLDIGNRFDSRSFAKLIKIKPLADEPGEMVVMKTYQSEIYKAAQKELEALRVQLTKIPQST